MRKIKISNVQEMYGGLIINVCLEVTPYAFGIGSDFELPDKEMFFLIDELGISQHDTLEELNDCLNPDIKFRTRLQNGLFVSGNTASVDINKFIKSLPEEFKQYDAMLKLYKNNYKG